MIFCVLRWTWSFVFIFIFVFVCIYVLCFCAATDFSVNKNLYKNILPAVHKTSRRIHAAGQNIAVHALHSKSLLGRLWKCGKVDPFGAIIYIYIYGVNWRHRIYGHDTAWNSLPDIILSAESINTFKRLLKSFLFSVSYPSQLQHVIPLPCINLCNASL